MNRSELEARVAARLDWRKGDARAAVDVVLEAITQAVAAGEEVKLVGFGTFATRLSPPITGRNPRTGAALDIPERRVVKFRAGRALKGAAANGEARAA